MGLHNQYQATVITTQEIEQQSLTQTEEKIAALIKAGALIESGTDYVFTVKFSQGQLTVNDKPFNPAMIQF